MIKFACSKCGKHIRVDDKYAGKKGKCPGCAEAVVVPGKSSAIRFACTHCGHRLKVPESYAGKKGKCPKCQEAVVVPAPKTEPEEQVQAPTVTCSACGEAIPMVEAATDDFVECPKCGNFVYTAAGAAASAEGEEEVDEESDETARESEGIDRRLILILAAVAVIVIVGIIGAIVFLKGSGPEPVRRPVARRAMRPVADTEPAPQPTDPAPAPATEPPEPAAAAAVQLHFAPAPGTKRIVQITTESISSMPENALQQSLTNRETLTFELEVLPPDGNGNTPIAVTLAAVQMTVESNGKVDAQYDSTAPLDNTNQLGKMYSPFVSGLCTMTVSAQGRIVDFDMDKFYRAVAEVRFAARGGATDPRYASREEHLAALKTQSENFPSLGKQQLCGTLKKLVAALPEQPLRQGDTWSRRIAVDFGAPLDMATTYTLAAADDKACTIEIDRRRGAEEAPVVQTADNVTYSYALSGASQATLTIDRPTGWLLRKEEKMTLSGQLEVHFADKPDQDMVHQIAVEINTTVTTLATESNDAALETEDSTASVPAATAAVQLRFAPAPGTKRTMRVTNRIDSSVQVAGQQHAITGIESLTFDFEAVEANADGAVPIKVTLTAVQARSEVGGVPMNEYDSAQPQNDTAGIAQNYDPFVGKTCTMTVSDRGNIVDLGLDELFQAAAEHQVRAEDIETQERLGSQEKAAQAIARMDQGFGARANRVRAMKEALEAFGKQKISGLLSGLVVALPGGALEQGSRWSRPIRIAQVSEGMEMATEHTLTTVAAEACTIQSEGHRSPDEAPIIEETGQGTTSSKLGGDCHSTVTVDPRTGWLLSKEQRTNLSGEMEISGTGQPGQDGTVPISMTITTTVTVVE